MTKNKTFPVDYKRINADVDKLIEAGQRAANFKNERIVKLQAALLAIQKWASACKLYNLELGNMYSSGYDNNAYSDQAALLVHGVAIGDKLYSNREKRAKFLQEKFNVMVNLDHPAVKARFSLRQADHSQQTNITITVYKD